MKGVNIFLADGFEDIEALGTRDVLVRGGISVNMVGIGEDPFVVSSHGVTIGIDCTLEDLVDSGASDKPADASDVMIFPGGMPGTKNLAACKELIRLMNGHYAEGGTVAAICAAPGLVLGQLKGIEDAEFTCFDSFEEIPVSKGARFVPKPAVTCGRIITGRSAGHAIAFGLAILRALRGEQVAAKVEHAMMLDCI